MSTKTFIIWILLLSALDQAIKVIIYLFFLDVHFELIPSLFEFLPTFNPDYSYLNNLLIKNCQIDIGMWLHIILYILSLYFLSLLFISLRIQSTQFRNILDFAFLFWYSAYFSGIMITNVFWKQGCLDYIYLKPLFIFDLKDVYINIFTLLLLFYVFKLRKSSFKLMSFKDFSIYLKQKIFFIKS